MENLLFLAKIDGVEYYYKPENSKYKFRIGRHYVHVDFEELPLGFMETLEVLKEDRLQPNIYLQEAA